MAVVTLLLTSDHGFLLTSVIAIALQCFIVGFIAGGKRSKIFNKDFMETYFRDIHFDATGEAITAGGYPDMGNGRYSEKLAYKDWYEFNNGQRAHYNFIENLVFILPFLLVGGIALPVITAWFGWAYFVGKIIYTWGYLRSGPKGRLIGASINALSTLGMFILSIISVVRIIKGTL